MIRDPVRLRDPNYWGTQSTAGWAPGETGIKPLFDLAAPMDGSPRAKPEGLWRVQIALAEPASLPWPTLAVSWAAGQGSQRLVGILPPTLIYLPGNARMTAMLTTPATSSLQVVATITPVSGSPTHGYVRTLVPTGGVAPPTCVRVVALEASTVTPIGAPAPIPLLAGQALDVAGPVLVVTGSVYAEHVI